MKTMTKRTAENPAVRLREIQEEMLELLEEAEALIKKSGNKSAYNSAKSYWLAHVEIALSDNHDYLAGSMCSMEDTINAVDTENQDDD